MNVQAQECCTLLRGKSVKVFVTHHCLFSCSQADTQSEFFLTGQYQLVEFRTWGVRSIEMKLFSIKSLYFYHCKQLQTTFVTLWVKA